MTRHADALDASTCLFQYLVTGLKLAVAKFKFELGFPTSTRPFVFKRTSDYVQHVRYYQN